MSGGIELNLKLRNDDSINYYHLDPGKMGVGLFGYFTAGLNIFNVENGEWISGELPIIKPNSKDEWKHAWLSLIRSAEQKGIILHYKNYGEIEPGRYRVHFDFPGLTYQVSRDELNLNDGRIWLGKTNVQRQLIIE